MPATWAYFDTSVLVKRYIQEQGSVSARGLLRHHRLLTSALAPTEAVSAFRRRQTLGELAENHFMAILSRIRVDRAYWELIELSPLVLNQAEEVIIRTRLRTLDALHLASALTFQAASGLRIPFITSDEQQRDAAEELALEVLWVN